MQYMYCQRCTYEAHHHPAHLERLHLGQHIARKLLLQQLQDGLQACMHARTHAHRPSVVAGSVQGRAGESSKRPIPRCHRANVPVQGVGSFGPKHVTQ